MCSSKACHSCCSCEFPRPLYISLPADFLPSPPSSPTSIFLSLCLFLWSAPSSFPRELQDSLIFSFVSSFGLCSHSTFACSTFSHGLSSLLQRYLWQPRSSRHLRLERKAWSLASPFMRRGLSGGCLSSLCAKCGSQRVLMKDTRKRMVLHGTRLSTCSRMWVGHGHLEQARGKYTQSSRHGKDTGCIWLSIRSC